MTDDGDGTQVDVATDLSITGKVAQFGRGVLADVSSKLMGQFVENLERDVLSQPVPSRRSGRVADAGPHDRRTRGRTDRSARCRGGSVTKRVVPVAIGVLVLFVLWRLLRGRGD